MENIAVANKYLSRGDILNAIENALAEEEISIEEYGLLMRALENDYVVIRLDNGLFAIIVDKQNPKW